MGFRLEAGRGAGRYLTWRCSSAAPETYTRRIEGTQDMALGIRAKLFGGFGVVLALLAVVGGVGLKNTTDFAGQFQSLYNDRVVCLVQLGNIEQGLYELRLGAAQYGSLDAAGHAKVKTDEPKWLKQLDDNYRAYTSTALSADEKSTLGDWDQTYPAYLKTRARTIELHDQGDAQGTADAVYVVAEGISAQPVERGPQDTAGHVVDQEARPGHAIGPRQESGPGA